MDLGRHASNNLLSAFVVVSLALGTASCGNDPTSAESAGVGDSFAAKAVSVCQEALAQKQAWRPFPFPEFNPTQPDSSKFPEVAVFLKEETAVTFQAWLAGLEALGEPPRVQEAWDDVLAAVESIVQLNAAQIKAAEVDDSEAFVKATEGLGEAQVELLRASQAAGVAECADVHK
jgi:hypothetical protein